MTEEKSKFRAMLERAEKRGEKVDAFFYRIIATIQRALLRIGVATSTGWLELLFIAIALAFIACAWLVFFARLSSSAFEIGLFGLFWIGFFSLYCLVIIYRLAHRQVRRQRRGWQALLILGRVLNGLLILASTAFFIGPFAWIAWRVVTR